jgi:hypothetical protein
MTYLFLYVDPVSLDQFFNERDQAKMMLILLDKKRDDVNQSNQIQESSELHLKIIKNHIIMPFKDPWSDLII